MSECAIVKSIWTKVSLARYSNEVVSFEPEQRIPIDSAGRKRALVAHQRYFRSILESRSIRDKGTLPMERTSYGLRRSAYIQ